MSQEQGLHVDTDGIRRRLLDERRLLLAKANPTESVHALSPDERDSDEADAAVSTAFREAALWLAEDQRHKLALIDQALSRIAGGTYGRCESCGAAINPERLEALPYATQCIRCQQQADRQASRRASRGRDIKDW